MYVMFWCFCFVVVEDMKTLQQPLYRTSTPGRPGDPGLEEAHDSATIIF
jgi:hypothetical protein